MKKFGFVLIMALLLVGCELSDNAYSSSKYTYVDDPKERNEYEFYLQRANNVHVSTVVYKGKSYTVFSNSNGLYVIPEDKTNDSSIPNW